MLDGEERRATDVVDVKASTPAREEGQALRPGFQSGVPDIAL